MPTAAIHLGPGQMLMLAIPLAATFAVVVALRLGQVKRMGIATVRAAVQLTAVGFVIGSVFAADRWYWVVLTLVVMVAIAGFTAASQVSKRWLTNGVLLSVIMGVVSGAMLLYISAAVIRVGAWSPRYLIPVGGMLLGNAMTAAVLSAERIGSDLQLRRDEVEAMVALGAGGWQAAGPSFRKAVGAALTPTLNAMMIVGVVKFPGMMTGQMLGGTDPLQAAMYQLVILIGILGCDCLSATAVAAIEVRRRFRPRVYE